MYIYIIDKKLFMITLKEKMMQVKKFMKSWLRF